MELVSETDTGASPKPTPRLWGFPTHPRGLGEGGASPGVPSPALQGGKTQHGTRGSHHASQHGPRPWGGGGITQPLREPNCSVSVALHHGGSDGLGLTAPSPLPGGDPGRADGPLSPGFGYCRNKRRRHLHAGRAPCCPAKQLPLQDTGLVKVCETQHLPNWRLFRDLRSERDTEKEREVKCPRMSGNGVRITHFAQGTRVESK